jgi:hypothetical protein
VKKQFKKKKSKYKNKKKKKKRRRKKLEYDANDKLGPELDEGTS